MSDIAIRVDGLLLGAVLALTGVIFAILSLAAMALRRGSVAKAAIGVTGISVAAVGALALTIDAPVVSSRPYDWIDWLIVPWLVLVTLATMRLVRSARAS